MTLPKIAHTNEKWIQTLDLRASDKKVILNRRDLHDGIAQATIKLIHG